MINRFGQVREILYFCNDINMYRDKLIYEEVDHILYGYLVADSAAGRGR